MKRTIKILPLLFVFISTLLSCGYPDGNIDNVTINISQSSYYTQDEIQSAVDAVLQSFKSYSDCKLSVIYYTDSDCRYISETHASNLKISASNVITIRGSFSSGQRTLKTPYILSNETYDNYIWCLSRIDENSEWTIFLAHSG